MRYVRSRSGSVRTTLTTPPPPPPPRRLTLLRVSLSPLRKCFAFLAKSASASEFRSVELSSESDAGPDPPAASIASMRPLAPLSSAVAVLLVGGVCQAQFFRGLSNLFSGASSPFSGGLSNLFSGGDKFEDDGTQASISDLSRGRSNCGDG